MNKFEISICVVGGKDEDERIIYSGDNVLDLEQSIMDNELEVITDIDKYFLLNGFTFYSYRDYRNNIIIQNELI